MLIEPRLDLLASERAHLRVDADLGDSLFDALFEVFFGDAAAAVERQIAGILRNGLADGRQTAEIEMRRALVEAVRVADGNRQNIDAGTRDEFTRLLRIGHRLGDVHKAGAERAKLALDGGAVFMPDLNGLAGVCHILLKGELGAVVHDGGEAGLCRALDLFKIQPVTQMDGHGHLRSLGGAFGYGHEILKVDVRLDHAGLHDDQG